MNPGHARAPQGSILAIAFVLSLASAGFADETTRPSGPLALVKSSVAGVLGTVRSSTSGSPARSTGIVRASHELFDFNETARRALGPHWKGLSPGEQAEFVRLFTHTLDRTFVASVDGYTNEPVVFLGETIDGAWAHVTSRIVPKEGPAISIDYRLHKSNARWSVYDVVAERVSLVAHYRSQFNSVIGTSSSAQLLVRMRADRLLRREPSTQAPAVPDRFAAGLLLAVLTRHAPTPR
jgi:phospholipid transport system substrate-binding protein